MANEIICLDLDNLEAASWNLKLGTLPNSHTSLWDEHGRALYETQNLQVQLRRGKKEEQGPRRPVVAIGESTRNKLEQCLLKSLCRILDDRSSMAEYVWKCCASYLQYPVKCGGFVWDRTWL